MTHDTPYDVLVIGSGAAGLGMALRLDSGLRIGVVSKRELREGNTLYAQGGISAVLSDKDSIESHVQDTMIAGAGLCDEATVRLVVEHGPQNIHWLLEEGVEFTRKEENNPESGFHLTREGGHSHRRVIHSADSTGRAVETTLEQQARAGLRRLAGTDHREGRALAFHALDQDLGLAPGLFRRGEARGNDAGIVENQQIARIEQGRQIVELPVTPLAGQPVQTQQTARTALLERLLRNQFFR